jgi:hypothetical protein
MSASSSIAITVGAAISIDAAIKLSLMPTRIQACNDEIKTASAVMMANSPVGIWGLGTLIVP